MRVIAPQVCREHTTSPSAPQPIYNFSPSDPCMCWIGVGLSGAVIKNAWAGLYWLSNHSSSVANPPAWTTVIEHLIDTILWIVCVIKCCWKWVRCKNRRSVSQFGQKCLQLTMAQSQYGIQKNCFHFKLFDRLVSMQNFFGRQLHFI